MPDPSPDPEPVTSELVVHAARLIRLIRRETADEAPATLRLLSQLDELGATTVTALAASDRTAQPTMSAAVKSLVAQGLLARVANPADARSTLVTLTDAGQERLAAARRSHAAVLDRLVSETGVARDDLDRAVEVLRRLTETTPTPGSETP